jgi:predicted PurR-regulated permease PerM
MGVIGGLIVHGLIGVFIGPIVLAIAWELVQIWTREEIRSEPPVHAGEP